MSSVDRTARAPEVYKSFQRLADRMRFSGQNLICYPIAWYLGTMYPSAREGFQKGAGSERHSVDWVEYMLTICQRRGIRFLPEMYFAGTLKMKEQFGGQSEQDIWAGADTPALMTWDGTRSRGFYFNPPYYNVLHPVVRTGCEITSTRPSTATPSIPRWKESR